MSENKTPGILASENFSKVFTKRDRKLMSHYSRDKLLEIKVKLHMILIKLVLATIKLMKRFFPTQVSCVDVSHKQKKQTKSRECHPGYKGKKCENRE